MDDKTAARLERARGRRTRLDDDLDAREEVLDYRLTAYPGAVKGIVDVDPDQSSNVDAHADRIEDELDVEVVESGIPTDPKRLGGPFPGMEASERYPHDVYRYEILADAQ